MNAGIHQIAVHSDIVLISLVDIVALATRGLMETDLTVQVIVFRISL